MLKQKVNDLTLCSVCLDTFTDPRLLPCGHTFCLTCILDIHKQSRITCPQCRKQFTVQQNALNDLPPNFTVKELVETLPKCSSCHSRSFVNKCAHCASLLCDSCSPLHDQLVAEAMSLIDAVKLVSNLPKLTKNRSKMLKARLDDLSKAISSSFEKNCKDIMERKIELICHLDFLSSFVSQEQNEVHDGLIPLISTNVELIKSNKELQALICDCKAKIEVYKPLQDIYLDPSKFEFCIKNEANVSEILKSLGSLSVNGNEIDVNKHSLLLESLLPDVTSEPEGTSGGACAGLSESLVDLELTVSSEHEKKGNKRKSKKKRQKNKNKDCESFTAMPFLFDICKRMPSAVSFAKIKRSDELDLDYLFIAAGNCVVAFRIVEEKNPDDNWYEPYFGIELAKPVTDIIVQIFSKDEPTFAIYCTLGPTPSNHSSSIIEITKRGHEQKMRSIANGVRGLHGKNIFFTGALSFDIGWDKGLYIVQEKTNSLFFEYLETPLTMDGVYQLEVPNLIDPVDCKVLHPQSWEIEKKEKKQRRPRVRIVENIKMLFIADRNDGAVKIYSLALVNTLNIMERSWRIQHLCSLDGGPSIGKISIRPGPFSDNYPWEPITGSIFVPRPDAKKVDIFDFSARIIQDKCGCNFVKSFNESGPFENRMTPSGALASPDGDVVLFDSENPFVKIFPRVF